MSKLDRRVELWGVSNMDGESDREKILTRLFIDKDQSLADLCRLFEVSRPAMTACLRRHGLDLKSVGQSKANWKARRLGFENMGAFFEANWKDSFREMAEKLNLSIGCVRKEYAAYRAEKVEKEKNNAGAGDRDRASDGPGTGSDGTDEVAQV